ncbi:hypothetical protein BDV37DRAFT_289731 [Aspergillus pseudonomiae]|uniref:Uncharacterized protein n=1 Tax=Aspergillus pseudonomiae TaxID=1506151 RepID=A0A5N7CSA0_9EURO|nr:uncharacterized protein BDV37DRAFT_289731 [Aspergillus pseudonomiae]KAE8397081.1 hypothetical protein BDV37DRAFT_289731 [Aspergillus pseudonomiae]
MEYEYRKPTSIYCRLDEVDQLKKDLIPLNGWRFETNPPEKDMQQIVLYNENPFTGNEVEDAEPFRQLADLLLKKYNIELKDRGKMTYSPKEICCADESRQAAQLYYESLGNYARQKPEPSALHAVNTSHYGRAQTFNPIRISDQFENCRAAINQGNVKEAASILLTIDGHSLLEAHQKRFPGLVGTQEQSQWMPTENDAIDVWAKVNECWLGLGGYTLEELQRGTCLDFDSKESLYDWLHELVAHIVGVSEYLSYSGYVDCEEGIRQDDIITCYENCLDLLVQMGTTSST